MIIQVFPSILSKPNLNDFRTEIFYLLKNSLSVII